jgi:hypothetical protein
MEAAPRIKINLHDIFREHSRTTEEEEAADQQEHSEQSSLQEPIISIDLQ